MTFWHHSLTWNAWKVRMICGAKTKFNFVNFSFGQIITKISLVIFSFDFLTSSFDMKCMKRKNDLWCQKSRNFCVCLTKSLCHVNRSSYAFWLVGLVQFFAQNKYGRKVWYVIQRNGLFRVGHQKLSFKMMYSIVYLARVALEATFAILVILQEILDKICSFKVFYDFKVS